MTSDTKINVLPQSPEDSAKWLSEHGRENAAYWAGRYHSMQEDIERLKNQLSITQANLKNVNDEADQMRKALKVVYEASGSVCPF